MGTGRNHDMFGLNGFPIYLNCMSIYKTGTSFNSFNPIAFKTAIIGITGTVNIGFAIFS
ncbi:Uncharacterised protein [Chlamydia trachomatis]|nr:Uncharacterised protein [Chlamydia trachomatis]